MKLTEEQITQIQNHLKKCGIKYYEVYMEILDHMILGIEDIMTSDETISFENAFVQVKKEGFGLLGFGGFMEEKIKLVNIQTRIENFKMIKEYFTFPKMVLTTAVFVFYYFFMSFFENPNKPNSVLFMFIAMFGIFQIYYFYKFRKKENFKIFQIEKLSYFLNTLMLGVYFNNAVVNFFTDLVSFNYILVKLLMTTAFTFTLISLLILIEVRKKVIVQLKSQIFA
jgi:hypothetical protein